MPPVPHWRARFDVTADLESTERVLAKAELNLERWPVFLTEKRAGVLEQRWTDGDRVWRCYTKDPAGLPGPFGADLWVALGKLWNDERERPEDDTLRTTFGALAGILGLTRGGQTYRQIASTLVRMMSVHFSCKGTFRRPDGSYSRVQLFQLLSSVAFESKTDTAVVDTDVPLSFSQDSTIEIRFAPEIAESIHARVFRLLDVITYRQLHSPTARRLFRYLDQRRYQGGAGAKPTLDVPLRELKDRLPLASDAGNGLRRTLENAHSELLHAGVLRDWRFEKATGRGIDAWVCRYAFHTSELLPAPLLREEADPQFVSKMVREMLDVLRDDGSAKWYGKIAMRLPADAIRNILGGIKQELAAPDSFGLPALRKVFTTRIKQRAADMGISLE